MDADSVTARRLAYSRGRARNLDLLLRAGGRGEVEMTAEMLRSLARVADIIAFELAIVERDLAMGLVAA